MKLVFKCECIGKKQELCDVKNVAFTEGSLDGRKVYMLIVQYDDNTGDTITLSHPEFEVKKDE